MKAIILAAGEGSRLRPYTADRPKCLVELGGRTLLDWQIDTLRRSGIDVVVIGGYLAEMIDRPDVRSYRNPRWRETNMVYTLWCAEAELADDVIVSYADIVYEPRIVRALLAEPEDLAIVVDRQWERLWRMRYGDPLRDAETLRIGPAGHLVEIGKKPSSLAEIDAQYIGLMRFRGDGLRSLRRTYEAARDEAHMGRTPWGLVRPFEMAYMTDLLQAMIDRGERLKAVLTDGGWFEIDSAGDYEMMRARFADGTVRAVFDPDALGPPAGTSRPDRACSPAAAG